jgi:replication-associated recombination protein RarA
MKKEMVHFAVELDRSGNGNAVWNRLKIISCEDIGLADSNIVNNVVENYKTWKKLVGGKTGKSFESSSATKLFVSTVAEMSESPKSRMLATASGKIRCY